MRRRCADCAYVHFNDPKVAAIAFIAQDGKLLLIRRSVDPEKGKWALPAGFVDYGEDPRQTAIRETREETGLDIEPHTLLDVNLTTGFHKVIAIVYAASVTGGILRAADDADDARWFGPDEIPELAFEMTNRFVQEWIDEQLSASGESAR